MEYQTWALDIMAIQEEISNSKDSSFNASHGFVQR